jgi:hypothetical protein
VRRFNCQNALFADFSTSKKIFFASISFFQKKSIFAQAKTNFDDNNKQHTSPQPAAQQIRAKEVCVSVLTLKHYITSFVQALEVFL